MKKYMVLSIFMSAFVLGFLYFNSDTVKTITMEDFINYKIEKKKAKSQI